MSSMTLVSLGKFEGVTLSCFEGVWGSCRSVYLPIIIVRMYVRACIIPSLARLFLYIDLSPARKLRACACVCVELHTRGRVLGEL